MGTEYNQPTRPMLEVHIHILLSRRLRMHLRCLDEKKRSPLRGGAPGMARGSAFARSHDPSASGPEAQAGRGTPDDHETPPFGEVAVHQGNAKPANQGCRA